MRSLPLSAVGACLALAIVPVAEGRPYDFDGDGRQDAVLGMPGWSTGGTPNAGAVAVISVGDAGNAAHAVVLLEEGNSLPGTAEGDDAFGTAASSGDFDADGFADLAVDAPGDETVFVVSGHPDGLQLTRATALPISGELLAADLNGDRHSDLIVGALGADLSRSDDYGAGRVDIFLGGPGGLGMTPATKLRRPRRDDDGFGAELAVGDVDGDGRPDLVEGAQGSPEDTDGEGVPGHLSYCHGSPSGPRRCRALGSQLGGGPTALEIADVNGDGYGDVIAGHPINRFVIDPGYDDPPGALRIWLGSRTGPQGPPLTITQNTPGIPGRSKGQDEFGASLVTADVDGDKYADLVIGAPGENNGRGRVTLLRGGPNGYATAGNSTLQEGRAGLPGARHVDDRFGHALTLLQHDTARGPDLVIGAPGDQAVTIVSGLRAGRFAGASRVTPTGLGMALPPEPPDVLPGFGSIVGAP